MRIWTYERPFRYENEDYEVKFSFSLLSYTSQLFCNGILIDECTCSFQSGLGIIEHTFHPENQVEPLTVSVGYFSWWSVGIEVRRNNDLIYASHPGENIHFAVKKLEKMNAASTSTTAVEKRQQQSEKWQKNKHSIIADIGLGAAFFAVAKVTGDLTTAAFTGVILGLALVLVQRFVKVDLLGGFAVFGTIMLLISAVFSLVFQSEHIVQLKGTILGILSASVLLTDGIFRKGSYFGPRFERYLSSPVDQKFFVIGLSIIGLLMAAVNYSVATQLTEDAWLTYTTFLDTPLYLIMFFFLVWRAEKRYAEAA